jgi:hypothetical protein
MSSEPCYRMLLVTSCDRIHDTQEDMKVYLNRFMSNLNWNILLRCINNKEQFYVRRTEVTYFGVEYMPSSDTCYELVREFEILVLSNDSYISTCPILKFIQDVREVWNQLEF